MFSGSPDSSTNKTGLLDITEMLLNMVLITIKQTNKQTNYPVINTSTDYKKSDLVHFSESNTILLCMHTVRHLYTERIQQYQQEAARQVIGV